MGEIIGAILTTLMAWILNIMLLQSFFTGDQTTTFHQALREAGRAAANYPAPSFDPNASGTSLASDSLMVDQAYLSFKAAFAAGVPKGTIDSIIYNPQSSSNPEDIEVTATVEIPRYVFNVLQLIGGSAFSPTIKETFTVFYYREWDYNNAISNGAINPSNDGPAQSS